MLRSAPAHSWVVECYGPAGTLKWRDVIVDNLIVDTGLNEILEQVWKGSAYTASHFVGLTDTNPTVDATDTMASHIGWIEITDYSETVRETLTLGTVAAQSVDNSLSQASFSITGAPTIGGLFLTTNNTKAGSTGILMGAGAFTGGDKTLAAGDTLNVTATLTMAAS